MYVCVAEKCEIVDFLRFFSTVVFIDNFPPSLGKKKPKMMDFYVCMYVCMCKAKSIIDGFFFVFFCTFP